MRYQSKHSIARVVRSLSVRLRVTVLACALAVAGMGTALAASAASASTASAGSAGTPIVGCVNIGARPYRFVPWRGLWRVYIAMPGKTCPSGSLKATFVSEGQLSNVQSQVTSNASNIASNTTTINSNKIQINNNTTSIQANANNIAALQNIGQAAYGSLLPPGDFPMSIKTGGSFATYATPIGTIQLSPGTYLINFNAKATPTDTSGVQVFPQFFVYNQAKNSSFTGDLFNIGVGALESPTSTEVTNNDVIDSYYNGSDVITVPPGGETLHFYAFGYDSDTSAGTYNLDSATAAAIRLAG